MADDGLWTPERLKELRGQMAMHLNQGKDGHVHIYTFQDCPRLGMADGSNAIRSCRRRSWSTRRRFRTCRPRATCSTQNRRRHRPMADGTKIEWAEATWNVITGCEVLSPGCTNCYAMRLAGTRLKDHPSRAGLTDMTRAGPVWNGKVRFNEQWLDQPLRWRKPRKIFVCAHGDLFYEKVPDEWIDRVFAVMALAPRHTFLVLTKRAARMREYMTSIDNNNGIRLEGFRDALIEGMAQKLHHERTGEDPSLWLAVNLPLPNVWLGVSVEDQQRADERIPLLLDTPAAVRWISAEPLLGAISLKSIHTHGGWYDALEGWRSVRESPAPEGLLDWVVAGGESSQNKPYRDVITGAFRAMRDQCRAANVPFFMKQMPGKAPIPADLMVREWPDG